MAKVTIKKIYNERPEIREKVEAKYPIIDDERRCRTHRNMRDFMRFEYAKKLYDEQK